MSLNVQFDDKIFLKEMMNIVAYSEGYLEGIHNGKEKFLQKLAKDAIQIFKEFVDQNARIDPQMYHHIYEWYQVGSPDARLFDIEYATSGGGLTFHGTLSQSKTVQQGSYIPFYDKAQVMEKGLPVLIKPVKSSVLTFTINGEQVFTPNEVTVEHPGGTRVAGSFEHVFDIFFKQYFTQSVLEATGIREYMQNSKLYKENLYADKNGGRAKGVEIGYNWITKVGIPNV
jgi:hypothetical protein